MTNSSIAEHKKGEPVKRCDEAVATSPLKLDASIYLDLFALIESTTDSRCLSSLRKNMRFTSSLMAGVNRKLRNASGLQGRILPHVSFYQPVSW
jgi:hypothetical protein